MMSVLCLLNIVLVGASMNLATNANYGGHFSHVFPLYSNITEFNSENISVFPKRPENFQIEYLKKTQIKLSWKIDQESLKSLQGFGLHVNRNYGMTTKIRIPDNITDFEVVLNVGYGSCEIVLYSLPCKSECFSAVRKTAVMFIRNDQDELPSTWISPLFVFSQRNNKLEMDFTESLDNYDFVKYKICLWNKNISRCSTIEKPPLSFENIPDSSYNISVIPLNRSSNYKESCCRDDNNCTACYVKEISFTSQAFCPVIEHAKSLYPVLGGVFIGILAIVILALSVKVNGLKSQTLERKLVLLIHTNDNEIHANAVENVIACLESIDVVVLRPTLPIRQEELQWLLSSFDNILLLDSPALGHRQDAWAVGKDYQRFLVEDHSKEVTKNLFTIINMCYDPMKEKQFLRCKWDFVPKESEFKNYPSNSPIFILPDDLEDLAEAIHGVSVDMRACKLPKNSLKENILREAEFVLKNPNWFQEKYSTPVCTDNDVEPPCQPHLYPVLHGSDLVSRVSSQMHKINENTDKALGLNKIYLNCLDEMSV